MNTKDAFPKLIRSLQLRTLLLWAVLLGLLAFVTAQAFVIRSVEGRVENMQQSIGAVIDEVGKKLTVAEQLQVFGKDMNELRRFLYLPPKDYALSGEVDAAPAESENEDTRLSRGLFQVLDEVQTEQAHTTATDAARAHLLALRADTAQQAALSAAKLTFAPAPVLDGQILSLTINGPQLFRRLSFHRDTGEWEIFGPRHSQVFPTQAGFDAAFQALSANLAQEREADLAQAKLSSQLGAMLRERSVMAILAKARLQADGLALRSGDHAAVAEIVIADDLSLSFKAGKDESHFATPEALQTALPGLIAALDTRSAAERAVDARIAQLKNLFADTTFQRLLTEQGLHIGDAKWDNDRIAYPLLDASGHTDRQFVIERNAAARLLIVDGQGGQPRLLEDLSSDPQAKEAIPASLPPLTRKEGESEVFLIAGKNGSLVDTMILARVVPANRSITLLSIPRDLQWNNRKINEVWIRFGMDEFKRQLGKLTGYPVDHAVLIDMYAFVQTVDLVGGLDVTLTQRLIDPSYRTLDDGKWGTLDFEPGPHHVNGAQALRLARSRHSTSDFSRAERQQMLIGALQQKAQGLRAGDTSALIDLVQVGLANTQTDLTPQEAIQDAARFSGYTIRRGAVMSTANILYSKRTNDEAVASEQSRCAQLTDEAAKSECAANLGSMDKGAYILLPTGDNWQLPKWYAWKTFEG